MPVTIKGETYYDWEPLEAEIKRLLYESEWTQLLDSPLSEPNRLAMAAWRTELWQILQTVTPPYEVVIPACPLAYWAQSSASPYGLVVPPYEPD